MKDDFVENRRRALEDSFFANENARLIEKMRAQVAQEKQKKSLADVSGINDDHVLDALIKAGVKAETLAALSLAPMVIVAWADGTIDPKEREAVIHGVREAGIDEKSPANDLVANWLNDKPDASLEQAWHSYIESLKPTLDTDTLGRLKTDIMTRSRRVAEAAGGFLGLSSPISKQETDALARLEKAFM